MVMQLTQGQKISANYSLKHRIVESGKTDCWLAFDEDLGETVLLKFFKQPLSENELQLTRQNVTRQRGLLHSHIARNYKLDQFEGQDFLVSQYVESAESLSQNLSFAAQWPYLLEAAKALEFAHGLGFAHGSLHPNNILIDAQGKTFLTDFGVTTGRADKFASYLSPQIIAGHPIDLSDDIYSFGQLVHKALTGKFWHTGQTFESSLALTEEFKQILTSMLQDSPYNRPTELGAFIQAAETYLAADSKEDSQEASTHTTSVSRPNPEPTTAIPIRPLETVSANSHALPRDRNTISTRSAFMGLGILVTAAIGLFFFLPEMTPVARVTSQSQPIQSVQSHATAKEQAAVEEEIVLGPLELAKIAKLEEQGRTLATDLLRLQIELEDIGGQIWASKDYLQAANIGLAGDVSYREKQFELAFEQYQEAISLLQQTLDSADMVFAENQVVGANALQDGHAQTAIVAYTILSAIDSDDPEIQANLIRAENLEAVLSLVSEGIVIERNGELELARDKFQQAAALDNQWTNARLALARVTKKIANVAFNAKMSVAFVALKERAYDDATQAFNDAQSILPNSNEPKDGLQQVAIAKIQAEIESHQNLANGFIEEEKWREAIAEFDVILSQSPGTVYAVNGLRESQKRQDLEDELLQYINQPNLMHEDDVLTDAKKALLTAARIKQPGPRTNDQINRLSHLISLARIPIVVNVISDNKTDVTLLKHQNFGRLESTQLELNPGIYTFVGERKGYRAVHQEIILRGGKPVDPILISCTEKI